MESNFIISTNKIVYNFSEPVSAESRKRYYGIIFGSSQNVKSNEK